MIQRAGLMKKRTTEMKIFFQEIDFPDPFLDSFSQETFVCHAILDKANVCPANSVTLEINKDFLKKLVNSHLLYIKAMED